MATLEDSLLIGDKTSPEAIRLELSKLITARKKDSEPTTSTKTEESTSDAVLDTGTVSAFLYPSLIIVPLVIVIITVLFLKIGVLSKVILTILLIFILVIFVMYFNKYDIVETLSKIDNKLALKNNEQKLKNYNFHDN
ncbi:hypothetical protein PvNV_046 [Penaeus vannamei nudivirus]|nr:hypothetical protein PvSNPV_046 [Penaeus vannamei nucleopolyhedrovirus]